MASGFDLSKLYEAIVSGDARTAAAESRSAAAGSANPVRVIADCMVPAMEEVGRRYEAEQYFVPEMLLAARAMKAALEPIRPILAARGGPPAGRVVIGTVRGDLHDVGKNLVASMLEGHGFEVIDLGTDVAPESFVAAVRTSKPDILALSALLTVTMQSMRDTIRELEHAGVRREVKVMVGGAPVSQGFADRIGADGYSVSAAGAVTLARTLLSR